MNPCLLVKNLLVSLFRGLLFLGAVVIGAVVVGSRQRQDPTHLALQGSLNRFRLALTSSDPAHVGRVEIELACDAAIEAPKERRKVKWRRAKAAFDFCHHSCYPFPMFHSDGVGIDIIVTGMLYQFR
jgi:hypothetical protein